MKNLPKIIWVDVSGGRVKISTVDPLEEVDIPQRVIYRSLEGRFAILSGSYYGGDGGFILTDCILDQDWRYNTIEQAQYKANSIVKDELPPAQNRKRPRRARNQQWVI